MELQYQSAYFEKLCLGDNFILHQQAVENACLPDSCRWFLRHEKTKDWLYGRGGPVLWVHGPGIKSCYSSIIKFVINVHTAATGKTFSSSSLKMYAKEFQLQAGHVAVAVVHLDKKREHYSHASYGYALDSVARQLITQLPSNSSLLKSLLQGTTELPPYIYAAADELYVMVNRISLEFDKTLIVLDGLGIASEDGLQDLIATLVGSEEQRTSIRIMLTSHLSPPATLLPWGQALPVIEARASKEDLMAYTYTSLLYDKEHSAIGESSPQTNMMYRNLVDISDGVFLPLPPARLCGVSDLNDVLTNLVNRKLENPNMNVIQALCNAIHKYINATTDKEMILCVLYYVFVVSQAGYIFTLPMAYEALAAWGIKHEDGTFYTTWDINESCASFLLMEPVSQGLRMRSSLLESYLGLEVFGDDYHERNITASMCYLSKEEFANGACNSSKDLKERFQKHPYLWYAARMLSSNLANLTKTVPRSFVSDFIRLVAKRGSIESYQQASEAWPYSDDASYDKEEKSEERWKTLVEALIEVLIDRGEDLEARAENNCTALHVAADCPGHAGVAQAFLEWGSNVNVTDDDDNTPLSNAIVNGDLAVVKLLLDSGADVTAVHEDDLLWCVREKSDIAHYLVERGVQMPADVLDSDDGSCSSI